MRSEWLDGAQARSLITPHGEEVTAMPMRPLFSLAALLTPLLTLAAVPAYAAQLYKWVDERGVTNYSDQAPAGAVKRQDLGTNRVSVYTPDAQLKEAIEAERARAINDLRTARRERQLHEEWLARQYLAAARSTSSYTVDPCFGNPSCGAYSPYAYAPVGRLVGSRGVRILPQINLTPGTTAGNVTAGSGYIPGNSAFAPGAVAAAQGPHLEGARSGGFAARGGFGGGHRR